MSNVKKLPEEIIRATFDYDAATGILTWKKSPARNVRVGDKAGHLRKNGYMTINFGEFGRVTIHRIAWTHAYGNIPEGMHLDHIDGDRSNNALSNLRLADDLQNAWNKAVSSRSRTGIKGVYRNQTGNTKQWRSQIQVAKKTIYLGAFETAEEASIAYQSAAKTYFGEFARLA